MYFIDKLGRNGNQQESKFSVPHPVHAYIMSVYI